MFKILVITPLLHIKDVKNVLESIGHVDYLDDPSDADVHKIIHDYDAIYTNPNKSKVFIGKALLDLAKKLKVIVTASTGTNHIDKVYAKKNSIPIISLTEERHVIERISSTAELAFGLTLSSIRNIVKSHNKALNGEWDYTHYIGRQMNSITVGVIGYGRLGKMYAKYCQSFGAKVIVYDPYLEVIEKKINQVDDIVKLINMSDVISIHVHVSDETTNMIDKVFFKEMKSDVIIINTARGEVINEIDLVEFLKNNSDAKIATDVLTDEIRDRKNSPLFKYALKSDNVIITQHIGGMTREAQEIAYGHVATLLKKFFLQIGK